MAAVAMATVKYAVIFNLEICVFSSVHRLHGVKWLNAIIIAKMQTSYQPLWYLKVSFATTGHI